MFALCLKGKVFGFRHHPSNPRQSFPQFLIKELDVIDDLFVVFEESVIFSFVLLLLPFSSLKGELHLPAFGVIHDFVVFILLRRQQLRVFIDLLLQLIEPKLYFFLLLSSFGMSDGKFLDLPLHFLLFLGIRDELLLELEILFVMIDLRLANRGELFVIQYILPFSFHKIHFHLCNLLLGLLNLLFAFYFIFRVLVLVQLIKKEGEFLPQQENEFEIVPDLALNSSTIPLVVLGLAGAFFELGLPSAGQGSPGNSCPLL